MTTRHLVLMRHAKSRRDALAPDGRLLTDHARPLAPRGLRDAPRVAAWLRATGWQPDAVVLSDAARTCETWAAMAPILGPALPRRIVPALYLAGLRALQADTATWDPAWQCVLALGHNPGWEQAASSLGSAPVELKTASCALLEGAGPSWALALTSPWRLVRLLHPRELDP